MTKHTTEPTITIQLVKHIAELANLPLTSQEATDFTQAFAEILTVINHLSSVNVSNIEPTHQVTGLTNITREDEIDQDYTLTQQQALANAKTHQGYFLVDRILDND